LTKNQRANPDEKRRVDPDCPVTRIAQPPQSRGGGRAVSADLVHRTLRVFTSRSSVEHRAWRRFNHPAAATHIIVGRVYRCGC